MFWYVPYAQKRAAIFTLSIFHRDTFEMRRGGRLGFYPPSGQNLSVSLLHRTFNQGDGLHLSFQRSLGIVTFTLRAAIMSTYYNIHSVQFVL